MTVCLILNEIIEFLNQWKDNEKIFQRVVQYCNHHYTNRSNIYLRVTMSIVFIPLGFTTKSNNFLSCHLLVSCLEILWYTWGVSIAINIHSKLIALLEKAIISLSFLVSTYQYKELWYRRGLSLFFCQQKFTIFRFSLLSLKYNVFQIVINRIQNSLKCTPNSREFLIDWPIRKHSNFPH